ncbi:RDD family protein [Pseudonocardia humida]|uniref:RDD family protein n=1 Tax=Pseudonocardia humida TaxID=2800819 RepID=A0ABT0ZXC6_9PSEU|nr:RDD family protein [Pseudonocardia humida]MCO1655361.1 RDD family protein [Pseudonocardia humida]
MLHSPAPFPRRLAARLIDLGFALVLTFALVIPFTLVLLVVRPVLEPVLGRQGLITVFVVVCYFLAYVGLEVYLLARRGGQTLGKGLMGLRVVPAAESRPAGVAPGAATARMLLIFVPFVLMSAAGGNPDVAVLDALALVGALSLLVSLLLAGFGGARRRAVHDLVAGTRVVRADKRGIVLGEDLRMMVPGRVDLSKRL